MQFLGHYIMLAPAGACIRKLATRSPRDGQKALSRPSASNLFSMIGNIDASSVRAGRTEIQSIGIFSLTRSDVAGLGGEQASDQQLSGLASGADAPRPQGPNIKQTSRALAVAQPLLRHKKVGTPADYTGTSIFTPTYRWASGPCGRLHPQACYALAARRSVALV